MGKVAFVFSGQGAQHVGMGQDFYESVPAVKEMYDAAEQVRPGTLEQTFTGDGAALKQTENTQPCLYLADLAAAVALRENGITPDAVAGFSLGEIPALAFAGAYSALDGFRIATKRGACMAAASDAEIATLKHCLEDLQNAKRYADAADAAFRFHHEMAIIGGNQILPLVYSSFRVPVSTLWERFCQKYGVAALYSNTERLFQHLAKRDLEGADAWIEEYLNKAISGEQTIYEL